MRRASRESVFKNWLRERVQTPRWSGALLAALLLSLAWISRENVWTNDSAVGRFVGEQVRDDRWRLSERPEYLHAKCVVWIDDQARLVEPADYYGSSEFHDYEEKDLPLVWLVWRVGATRAGWWAVTHETRWEELMVVNFRKIATPSQIDQAKQLYVADVPLYPVAAHVRVNRFRLVWRGVALDVATLLDVIALVYSLGWYRRVLVGRRGRRRIARGLCPQCKYDLSGLAANGQAQIARCPECGDLLPRIGP